MPLGRTFTMRSKRSESNLSKSRPAPPLPHSQVPPLPTLYGTRSDAPVTKRPVISGPIQLVSTTNMLTYSAPDLPVTRQVSDSTNEPRTSSDDSDSSAVSNKSRDTLTDASSVDNSPVCSTHQDEFKDFFKIPSPSNSLKRMSSVPEMSPRESDTAEASVPSIPQRKPSHSKRAHQNLARQKSMQHMRNGSSGTASTGLTRGLSLASRMSREQRESLDFFKGNMDPSHPFNQELQQLHEVAEELTTTVRDVEMCEDQRIMKERGLAHFTVDDYLSEIQPLYISHFGQRPPEPVTWI